MSYTLHEVDSPARHRQFLAVPRRLHGHRPQYIGPLDNEIEAVFDPRKNANLATGEAVRWVLLDADGVAVGRVAAFLNREAVDVKNPDLPTGGLGFFEGPDDPEAAHLLFDAGRAWLAARGMQAMDGPINFGERDRFWGVLIDGFEWEPNYGMFWHPPYYQALFEGYGFRLYFKQYTCHRPVITELHHSFAKRLAGFEADPRYRFDYGRKADPEKLAQDFHHVYNLAWGRHAGVKPMDLDQARALVREMTPVLDERLLAFAYCDDEPVAFFISLPELNQIFKYVGPRLNLVGKLRFVWQQWRYGRRRDKKMLGIIYGVVPIHQGTGLDSALILDAQKRFISGGYADIEMNWIGDFNPRMLVTTRSIGAKIRKTHATYRLLFDPNRPFERSPIIR